MPQSNDAGAMPAFKPVFRIDEAVAAYGLGRSTLYQMIQDKRLRLIKVGGRSLLLREDLDGIIADAVERAA